MNKSKIYKELLQPEINKIITDLYGHETKLIYADVLKGGLFNTTYKVHTNNDEKGIVLRVGPVNKHLLMDFEKDMMSAEPIFHKLLQDNNIPTSNIIKYSPENTVLKRDYIVIEFIESIPMNDPSLDNENLDYIYEDLGKITSRFHKIKNDRFGWLRNNEWGLNDKWSDFVCNFANEVADKLEQYELVSLNDINAFRQVFSSNIDVLDEIKTPNMIHTDLWQGNVLLSKNDDRYKVAAIIDLDRAIFGDKYWDLSTPWLINDAFKKGYKDQIIKTQSYKKRETIYSLILAFLNSYVCCVEYDDIKWFENEKQNALKILKDNKKLLL